MVDVFDTLFHSNVTPYIYHVFILHLKVDETIVRFVLLSSISKVTKKVGNAMGQRKREKQDRFAV